MPGGLLSEVATGSGLLGKLAFAGSVNCASDYAVSHWGGQACGSRPQRQGKARAWALGRRLPHHPDCGQSRRETGAAQLARRSRFLPPQTGCCSMLAACRALWVEEAPLI